MRRTNQLDPEHSDTRRMRRHDRLPQRELCTDFLHRLPHLPLVLARLAAVLRLDLFFARLDLDLLSAAERVLAAVARRRV